LGWPNPQTWPLRHLPQSITPPQPSLAIPQSKPCWAQVFVGHVQPHTFGVPVAPQGSPASFSHGGHAPHSIVPPHPSLTGPQFLPSCAQVDGGQPLVEDELLLDAALLAVDPCEPPPEVVPDELARSIVLPHAAASTIQTDA
jgi:hypothetical protein